MDRVGFSLAYYLDSDRPGSYGSGPFFVVGGVLVAGALAGAYSSYSQAQSAKAAAKAQSKGSTTDQTTTNTPYGADQTGGDITSILNLQRQLVANGPPQVGLGGGGGGVGGGAAHPAAASQQSSVTVQGGVPGVLSKSGTFQPLGAQAAAKWRASGSPVGGAPTAAAGAPATNYNDPTSISAAVARAGLNAGNDPTTQAAQKGVQNILSGQGGAGSGTGYQGFNPINDALAQNLQGKVGSANATDLIRQFLQNGGGGAGGGDAAGGGYSGGGGGGGGNSYGGYGSYADATAADRAMVNGQGGPPDSTAGSGTFNDNVKKLLDQGVDQQSIQTLIDAQNADLQRAGQSSLWALDAQSQGTGRLGGDAWKGLYVDSNRATADKILQNSASTRLSAQDQLNQMRENLLGQVNTRDIATMNDATNRYGIGASAAASAAGNASAAQIAMRGQNLQGLGMLLQNDQNDLGTLSGMGHDLTSAQLDAIGQAPGLAGIANAGLGQANNAASNDVSLRSAQISGGNQRAALNLQAQMYNNSAGQNQVNDYLRTVMGIGSMGGTTHTTGTNVQPIAYTGSPGAAALTGALGGAAGAGGLYNLYQGAH